MQPRILLLACFLFFFSKQEAIGQLGFSHEIGVVAGPLAFYSDYGQRNDIETNTGNVGFGVGLIHYINFAYRADCNCYTKGTYFNDHFKIRNEIDFHVTNFQHFGEYIEPNINLQTGEATFSPTAEYLRSVRGSTRVFDIGSQLEYFPLSIRDFTAGGSAFAPFVSLGVHFVSFNPEASLIDGSSPDITSITSSQTLNKYINAYQQSGDTTWSVVMGAGVRYKLTPLSDLMLDTRWQHYFSDWVDGLNPTFENNGVVQVPENKANDWIYWVTIGYIHYL